MHNIKDIRKDFNNFKNQLKSRNINIDLNNIKDLDERNRKLIQIKEDLENKKKKYQNQKMRVYLKNQRNYQKN